MNINNTPQSVIVTLPEEEILQHTPGLKDRGLMLGIHDHAFWGTVFSMLEVIDKDYMGGDLDGPTIACIMDDIEQEIFTISEMGIPDHQLIETRRCYYELITVAQHTRLLVPRHLYDFQYIDTLHKCVYVEASIIGL